MRQAVVQGKIPAQVARDLGVSEQTLSNWRKAYEASKLAKGSGMAVNPEQMELARLRAENARLKMEMEIEHREHYWHGLHSKVRSQNER